MSTSYGMKHPAPIIQLTQRDQSACFLTVVYPHLEPRPKISVEISEHDAGVRRLLEGTPTTIRITIKNDAQQYCDEVSIGDRTASVSKAPHSMASTHVRVSRMDSDERLLFYSQV